MTQPKVSIIIPTYNVEAYLKECLESVVNQTLKDIEIIAIDDGATDNSGKILDEYAKKDSRIKVIHKENGGYGKAMNVGLDNATGEYIGIVEPDDFVDLEMFETLYKTAKKHNADFVKSDFNRFIHDKKGKIIKEYISLDKKNNYYNKIINPQTDISTFNLVMNTWSGIYNREFLNKNKIRHNETPGASFQDNGFWFQTFVCATKAYFLNQAFYMCRRDNPNSSIKNTGKMLAFKVEYDWIRDWLNKQKNGSKFIGIYHYKRFHNYMFNYTRIDDSLKNEWLKIFSDDYKQAYDLNEIDETLFSENEIENLKTIIKNPENFSLKTKQKISFIERIFSIKNSSDKKYKIVRFFGFKIKFKRK